MSQDAGALCDCCNKSCIELGDADDPIEIVYNGRWTHETLTDSLSRARTARVCRACAELETCSWCSVCERPMAWGIRELHEFGDVCGLCYDQLQNDLGVPHRRYSVDEWTALAEARAAECVHERHPGRRTIRAVARALAKKYAPLDMDCAITLAWIAGRRADALDVSELLRVTACNLSLASPYVAGRHDERE